MQGKWHKSDIVPLFAAHNIEVDYTLRGFAEENIYEDKSGESVTRRNIMIRLLSSVSRPVRTFIKNKKILNGNSEADKRYSTLVLKPIIRWKKKDPQWSHYDYKSQIQS